jgi:tRNA A37 methylthiotransferase MiaB
MNENRGRRVSFHTLGCKLNFSESSTLAREFEQNGYVRVGSERDADVCVINSCSVTEHADKKCRNLVRKIHRRNPSAIIAVTGCYAQLKPQEIAKIEGVDIVLSNNDKGDLYQRVAELMGRKAELPFVTSCQTEELTRLSSHFAQFREFLNSKNPSGRNMDFLAQEMFREINTLGNKSGNSSISPLVVIFKTELEKIREQIQNVE